MKKGIGYALQTILELSMEMVMIHVDDTSPRLGKTAVNSDCFSLIADYRVQIQAFKFNLKPKLFKTLCSISVSITI